MTNKDIDDWVNNKNLTQEDIGYLLNKLCKLGIESDIAISEKVTIFLKSRTHLNRINIEKTAEYLNMSSRTLSRKLKKEQTGFQKLLDNERQRRCLFYLEHNIVCGQKIVELLGLSDCSHFYRIFKRWTGYRFSEVKLRMAESTCDVDANIHRKMRILNR